MVRQFDWMLIWVDWFIEFSCYVLQVRLVFDEPEPGVTVVKLTHTDVPEEDRLVLVNGFITLL